MRKLSKDAMKSMMVILFLVAMGFFVLTGFLIHKVLGSFLVGVFCLFLAIGAHEALKKKEKDQ